MNLEQKYSLAIHTTTSDLGLAISSFREDTRCQIWNLGRDLATQFHQYLAEFIQPQTWRDLDFITVAKGPGGFTGTRIGVVTARTLAQQLEIPLFAISTLETVAWREIKKRTENFEDQIALQMQAQRGQLFVAIYQPQFSASEPNFDLVPILPDMVMSPDEWKQVLNQQTTSYQLIQIENSLGDTALSLLELAHHHWQKGQRPHWLDAVPYYGQHPVE